MACGGVDGGLQNLTADKFHAAAIEFSHLLRRADELLPEAAAVGNIREPDDAAGDDQIQLVERDKSGIRKAGGVKNPPPPDTASIIPARNMAGQTIRKAESVGSICFAPLTVAGK